MASPFDTAIAVVSSGKWLPLIAFVVLCVAIAALGSAATVRSVGTWYQALKKPPFNPPDWLFGPIWSLLYLMIAVAGWRAWLADGPSLHTAMAVYAAQLLLNLLWSVLFFGLRMIGLALAEIVVLLAAIAVNIVYFWRVEPMAGWLLCPYAAWVGYASVLNWALWRLN